MWRMTITRYNPNSHLVAPSTELRMVEDAQGEYVRYDELESLRTVAASMRQLIERQTKLIEDARYLIGAWDRGAERSEYARDRWEWMDDLAGPAATQQPENG